MRELLGAGGQGEVYRAEQPALDREAVIKTLTGGAGIGAERFLREARLASRLDHPYAAHVYAFGVEPDGVLWIAMELVRGITLSRWLETEGPIPLGRFVPLLERVCEVVQTAHDQGIIHRDLKPGNVMVVTRAGRLLPKLLDFGIAKAMAPAVSGPPPPAVSSPPRTGPPPRAEPIDVQARTLVPDQSSAGDETLPAADSDKTAVVSRSNTPTSNSGPSGELTFDGALLGSPMYMAPELWYEPADAGIQADIYALGALAYECLAGRPPFEETSLEAMAAAHTSSPVPPLGGDFPAGLDDVLRRAMAKSPARRHPTALELAQDFALAAGLAPIEPSPAPAEVVDGALRELWIARAPAPLAEIVPRLGGRKAGEMGEAILSLTRAAARYVGILALACRNRIARDARDPPEVSRLVGALRRGTLEPEQWTELARRLTAPFLDRPDVYPVPELIALCHPPGGRDPFVDLLETVVGAEGSLDEATRQTWRASLERLLAACEPLLEYRLVVLRSGSAESWMGVRRFHRPVSVVRRRPLQPNEVVLIDADGNPIVSLWPAAQIAAPMPEREEEMFLLAGGGIHGGRLVAESHGFERRDDAVWSWFAEHGLGDDTFRTTAAGERRRPYRALLSLTRDDADFYFGREREIDGLVNRLRVQPFVAVVGTSGVGKSSFVHAGVVPALGPDWQVLTVRPGPHPFAALEAALDRAGVPVADLAARPELVALRLRALRGARVLLVVDQLEEMFTLCGDEAERERFASALVHAVPSATDPVRVVVTLRDDFLVSAEQLPGFRGLIIRGMQLLTTPHEEDLVRILEEPARLVGYSFADDELPREMVREVARRPGALALLSFAASELWERRDRDLRLLTREAHAAIGGVAGALAQHADRVVEGMAADERPAVRELFQQLFTAEGTRAVLWHQELVESLGRGAEGERILDRLIEARLVVASEGEEGVATVEIAHEALLHAWPRLAEWRRADIEGTRRREQLQAAARQWRDRGRGRELLWRGDVLTEYALWWKGYAGRLGGLEAEFLDESVRDATRARRFRRAIAVGAALLVLVGSLALLWANRRTEAQKRVAESERRAAQASADEARARLIELRFEQARQTHLGGSSLEALAYLREAFSSRTAPDLSMRYLAAAAMRALDSELRVLRPGAGAVTAVRFARGDSLIVTGGRDGPAAIWETAGARRVRTLEGLANALALDVSADGELVAAGSGDEAVEVWRTESGQPVARFDGFAGRVECVDLSPDGSRLLAASLGGKARLYRLAPAPALAVDIQVPDGIIHSCQLSPDGRSLLTSSTQARVWDAKSGRLVFTLGEPRPTTLARLSPDGTRIVTYTRSDLTPELWDARTGRRVARLHGHAVGVFDSKFSPDSRTVATAGRDQSAKLWDAEDGALRLSLPHPGEVNAVAFDATSRRVATSGSDPRIRIWQSDKGRMLASMEGHLDLVDDLAFSPDGTRLLTASRDGTVRLWRSSTPGLEQVLTSPEPLFSSTFSGDGRRVLTFTHGGRATVWDLASGRPVAQLAGGEVLMDPARFVSLLSARIVPALDGAGRLAAIPTRGEVALYDVDSGRQVASLDHGTRVICARFSPDGRWLATASVDRLVRIWDVERAALERELEGHQSRIWSIDFSPDGGRLASGDLVGDLFVWRLADGARLYSVKASPRAITAISFSPDGQRIATGSLSRPINVWRSDRPEIVATLEVTEGTIGLDFAPDGGRLVAIHGDGRATVWDPRRSSLLDKIGIGGQQGYWVEVSPDGERALLTGEDVELWDIRPYRGEAAALVERLGALPYVVEGERVIRTEGGVRK